MNHPEVRLVNVSLAGDIPLSGDCTDLTPSLQAYAASVDALRAQGTTVFAASGNNGAHNGIPAPACFPATVAVGAVYARAFGPFTAPNVCVDATTAADQVACFSNSSSELDLLAAGAPVDSIGLDSAPDATAGTSAASAQAAGAAALLLQADPQLTPDGLERLLESTGVRLTDSRSRFTVPRIDVAAALGAVLGRPVSLLPPPDGPGALAAPALSRPTVPRVEVSTAPISFSSVRLGRAVMRRLVVSNTGTGHLAVRIRALPSWVSARPAKLTIDAAQRRTIVFTFRPTHTGRYQGRVGLATDDPRRLNIVIGVHGTGRTRSR